MSSVNCCLVQDAPSPDGPPSRPIRLRTRPETLFDPLPCHKSSSLYSSSSISLPLSKQDGIGELQAIFDESKFPLGDGTYFPRTKRSSGSLASVKQRLMKHLSLELKPHRRRSRSTLGASEGVERRAELRRIRQKRIQDELVDNFEYDSDARSLTSIARVTSKGEEVVNYETCGYGRPYSATRVPSIWIPTVTSPEPPSLGK